MSPALDGEAVLGTLSYSQHYIDQSREEELTQYSLVELIRECNPSFDPNDLRRTAHQLPKGHPTQGYQKCF